MSSRRCVIATGRDPTRPTANAQGYITNIHISSIVNIDPSRRRKCLELVYLLAILTVRYGLLRHGTVEQFAVENGNETNDPTFDDPRFA
jgi:hypothetical protein